MSIDRAVLDEARKRVGLILKAEQDDIERPFSKVLHPERSGVVSFVGMTEAKNAEEQENVKFSFHHETRGRGDTAQEAFDDWKAKLKRPHGDILYWRAVPEIDYTIDFRDGKAIWRVYSRYAILKPEG